jgi:hypothetical protein
MSLCFNRNYRQHLTDICNIQEFSVLHVVQTDSGTHRASYPMGNGVKQPGREADHSPSTSAEVKRTWIYTSTPPYAIMA